VAETSETPGAGADLPVRRVRRGLRRRDAASRPPAGPSRVDRADAISAVTGRGVLGRVVGGGGDRALLTDEALRRPSRWVPTADQLDLLASLLDAGLPLLDALHTLGDMSIDNSNRSALSHLRTRVHSGEQLAVAIAELGVPAHVRMLVTGGERTGGLADALRSAGVLTARIETLRGEVRRALVYPGVVLAIGLVILTVIAVAVVPPLERTFADLGGELPRATQIVLAASRPLSSPISLAVLAGTSASVVLLRRASNSSGEKRLRRSVTDRRSRLASMSPIIEAVRDRLPLSGRLRRDLRLTVIAHVIASLVNGGVPLDAALRHVAHGLAPGRLRQVLQDSADATRQGRSPFEADLLGRILDIAEREMLRVGERNGLVATQWKRVADRREHFLEHHMKRVSIVIEPILVALIGGVVGGAVLALYLPTFRVMELL